MSQIEIEQPYTMPVTDVRVQVDALAGKLRDRFGAQTQWVDDVLEFSGSGITGKISIEPQRVVVAADLGFLFAMMRGPVEDEIKRVLSERLY